MGRPSGSRGATLVARARPVAVEGGGPTGSAPPGRPAQATGVIPPRRGTVADTTAAPTGAAAYPRRRPAGTSASSSSCSISSMDPTPTSATAPTAAVALRVPVRGPRARTFLASDPRTTGARVYDARKATVIASPSSALVGSAAALAGAPIGGPGAVRPTARARPVPG